MISLFALLLLAVQAQAQKQPLAVLVVGVDNWMFGDVIAHIVGEELKRSNPNLVPVTREKFVQNKLKALRRATDDVKSCKLSEWANAQGLSQICFVEAKKNGTTAFSFNSAQQSYSAQLIDATSNTMSCAADFTFNRGGGGEMAAAELTKVAWEVVGRLQSNSCKTSTYIKCYPFEPEMVFVKGGVFEMGCKSPRDTQTGMKCSADNSPPIYAKVSDFWIGKYEVTQAEWREVMKNAWDKDHFGRDYSLANPSNHEDCDLCPVNSVRWTHIQRFLDTLNKHTGKKYQLPTEAQWEYAARGGAKMYDAGFCGGNGCVFSGSNISWHVAWYDLNLSGLPYDSRTQEVGTRKTNLSPGTLLSPVVNGNQLGIHDMSGNIAEFCADAWWSWSTLETSFANPYNGDEVYSSPSVADRIIRGGSVFPTDADSSYITNAYRSSYPQGGSDFGLPHGFRVVLPVALP
ncbi:MAG: formylglycine-generating enzyme family protein [Prevotellaceae bacterium]|nr:formylglycine-generating enzyme family protein [Prevotellaceae bacterium]